MYKCIFMILALNLSICDLDAQVSKAQMVDSLKLMLKNYKHNCSSPCLKDSFKVNLLNDLGFYFSSLKLDSGIAYARQGMLLSEQIGWLRGKTDALVKIGDFLRLKGENDSSLFYNAKVLEICERTGCRDNSLYLNKGVAYYTSGLVERDNGNIPKALNYLEKALSIFNELKDLRRISNSYSGMGIAYESIGRYGEIGRAHV